MEVKAARCALNGRGGGGCENRSDGFGGEGCGNRTGLEGVERSGDMVRESHASRTRDDEMMDTPVTRLFLETRLLVTVSAHVPVSAVLVAAIPRGPLALCMCCGCLRVLRPRVLPYTSRGSPPTGAASRTQ